MHALEQAMSTLSPSFEAIHEGELKPLNLRHDHLLSFFPDIR